MSGDPRRIEIPLLEGELLAPPERYVVPAGVLPPLEEGTLVTYGEPGRWWAIDEAYTATPPQGRGADEVYGLIPFGEEVSMVLQADTAETPGAAETARGMWIATRDLWVYRDGGNQEVTDIEPWSHTAWFDRMGADDLTPPAVRRPRPARELPSLIGRRLRAFGRGEWHWLVAVSEPLTRGDAIVVKVVDLHRHGRMVGSRDLPDEPAIVSLHRLWTY